MYAAGNTVIIVTHEEDIAKHCHRIIRLIDGEVASDTLNENIIKVSKKNPIPVED